MTDEAGITVTDTFSIDILPTATISTTSGSTSSLNNGVGFTVDSGITIVQNQSISELRVSIIDQQDGDNLEVGITLPTEVTSSFNSTTGVLSISGSMTDAEAQSILQSVKFSTTSTNLSDRVIEFSLGSVQSLEDNGHFYELCLHQVLLGKTLEQQRAIAVYMDYQAI